MKDIRLMNFNEATQAMKRLGGKYGCTDFNAFVATHGSSFEKVFNVRKEVKNWEMDYLIAILSLGPHYGLEEKVTSDGHGGGTQSYWYTIAEAIRREINYRNSITGKKETLRKIAPVEVRGADEDALEKKRNARIQTDTLKGKIGLSKKQKRINEERLQHIYALEKTLEKGGSLRDVCDELYKEHNDCIENLPSNEEAAKVVMKEKRKCAFKSLVLSWFIMPVYILIRAIDILCDSVIVAKIKNDDLSSRFSPRSLLMGRLTIPYVLCGALTAIETADAVKHGGELMYGSVGYHAVFTFLGGLFAFTVAKTLVGVPAAYLADFIGKAVEWASDRFDPVDEYTVQFGAVELSAASYDHFKGLYDERQSVIRELRDAIKENRPRYEIDDLRKRGPLSFANLEKEAEEFAKVRKEEKL